MAVVTITSTNTEFGSCQVTFGGTDLGAFQGGVNTLYEITYKEVMADQLSSPLKSFILTETFVMTVNMLEVTLAVLQTVMPSGTYLSTGGAAIWVGGGQLVAGDYQQTILTPISDGSATITSDDNKKVTIHKALAKIQYAKAYDRENERIVPVEFHAYADTTKAAGRQLFLLGDSTAV